MSFPDSTGYPASIQCSPPILRSVPTVTPVGKQIDAMDAVTRWFFDPNSPQVFKLFGYAGTGKTTLAQFIVGQLGLRDVRYAAFSGKAAYVLRRKGCDGAQTVHSLIYKPVGASRAEIERLIKLAEEAENPESPTFDPMLAAVLRRQIEIEEAKLRQPRFELKEKSELADADLLILDEVSMVDRKMAADLLSFDTKIMCLGDPAQLPPVGSSEGYFTGSAPDILLTEIHRSALDSPVTRIATAIRQSTTGDRSNGVYGPDGDSGRRFDIDARHLLAFDQVLCWKRATRWALVDRMRAQLGRTGPDPEPGDRIMTLTNNVEAAVLNGQQFVVQTAAPVPGYDDRLDLTVIDEEGNERDLQVFKHAFYGDKAERDAGGKGRSGKTALATYAYALTCHKAQGSQWDDVLVVDETPGLWFVTMKQHGGQGEVVAREEAGLMTRRWLYTAATRAAQQVVIVNPGQVA